jgi:hypothetical protein
LFCIKAEQVKVLTEMFILDERIAAAFCHDVFLRYRDCRAVIFNAIRWPVHKMELPCQYFACSENYVLNLPDSVQAYESSLGKSTRKTLRGYNNRLMRDYPGFEWRSLPAADLPRHVQRALVRQLQVFKRNSMATRGKHAQSDSRETACMLALANDCGLYSLGTVNGKLCAGSLACRIGDNYVMLLCASDPEFSLYRLGLLACYWSICDCLRQQGRECHLLWGRYRYKEQLLAVPQPLYQLRIYRSRWHMLCSPASVLTMTGRRLKHRLRLWALALTPLRTVIGRAFSKARLLSSLPLHRQTASAAQSEPSG